MSAELLVKLVLNKFVEVKPVLTKFVIVPAVSNKLVAVILVNTLLVAVTLVRMLFVPNKFDTVIVVAVKLLTANEPAVSDPVITVLPPTYKLPEIEVPPYKMNDPVVNPVASVLFNTTMG
ncbi:MAG: hypothetical protein EBU90_22300 [Proteobacteria bacterium]|nr:hypothetical protein [Pseudomonadota bacterium]